MTVKVDIEFCDSCGYSNKFNELAQTIKESIPSAEVNGKEGRTGSFEVLVNDVLVHSKLRTMAFPDFTNVIDIVQEVADGKSVRQVDKQQPINCIII